MTCPRKVYDERTSPEWCPARSSVLVKFKPLPVGFHSWKGGDICLICGLERRKVKVSRRGGSQLLDQYRVDGQWTTLRPECKEKP